MWSGVRLVSAVHGTPGNVRRARKCHHCDVPPGSCPSRSPHQGPGEGSREQPSGRHRADPQRHAQAARARGRWGGRSRERADCLVTSRPSALRRCHGLAGRDLSNPGVVGQHHAPPPQPRRRSTPQSCAHDHHDRPHEGGSLNARVRGAAASRGAYHEGDHAVTEALHHPAAVPRPCRRAPGLGHLTDIEASWI